MDIKHPRRILFLGRPDSGVLPLLKELTGSAPEPRVIQPSPSQPHPHPSDDGHDAASTAVPATLSTTTAGLTHTLSIQNAYYNATVPIWLDEPTAPDEWKADFLTSEAGEVVRAVGAWVVVFRLNAAAASAGTGTDGSTSGAASGEGGWVRDKAWAVEMMEAIKAVIKEAHGGVEDAWDGVMLCVGMPGYVAGLTSADAEGEETGEEWEDVCWERGFEYIDGGIKGRRSGRDVNGESKGVRRLLEALEANDWSGEDEEDDDVLGLLDNDDGDDEFGAWESGMERDEDAGFALERREMEREITGLKMALNAQTQDDEENVDDGKRRQEEEMQVEELERMIGKMMAVKDMTAHMPENERKKFASRAVKDVMKTI